MRRNLDALERRLAKVAGRNVAVPLIPVIDATVFVDDQSFAEFAAADRENRDAMRDQLAGLEADLVARETADLPEPTNPRAITAIIVTTALPDEVDLWRLDTSDVADSLAREKRADIARRNALMAESVAEARRERAARLPMIERDWDPSGPDHEVLYFEEPSGWPVTRGEHQARMIG